MGRAHEVAKLGFRLLGAGIVVGALFGLALETVSLTNMRASEFHRLGIGFWLTYTLSTALSLASVWAGFAVVSRRPSRRRAVMIIFALAALMRLYSLAGWLIHIGYVLTVFEGVVWSSPWSWPLFVARAFQMMPYWAPPAILQVILLSCALAYLIATRRDPEFQPRRTITPAEIAPPETHRIVAAKIADGPDWRNALLTSLHKAAAPETPRQPAWPWVIALIAVAGLAFLASTFAEQAIAALDPTWRPLAWLVFTFISLGAIGLPFAAVRRRMLQARQRRAEDALNKSSAERPIFYLRSFALDEEVGRPSILELFLNAQPANPEQTMTKALGRCGPVIAIGRPGEKLPALGAARFYVAQDLLAGEGRRRRNGGAACRLGKRGDAGPAMGDLPSGALLDARQARALGPPPPSRSRRRRTRGAVGLVCRRPRRPIPEAFAQTARRDAILRLRQRVHADPLRRQGLFVPGRVDRFVARAAPLQRSSVVMS